jgi:hypothetical protein
LIASVAIAVLLGAAFASKDVILTTWYAYRLHSENVDEQKAAIASLGLLQTKRAACVLVDFLVNTRIPRVEIDGRAQWVPQLTTCDASMRALAHMGEVAMQPLANGLQRTDDFEGEPEQRQPGVRDSPAYHVLATLLEVQRKDAGVRSLLENIGSRVDEGDLLALLSWKYLAWKSGVQAIDGRPCRIFLFDSPGQGWPGSQPQTILLTDVAGRVITWKEVGGCGDPILLSCELETISGALFLVITCEDARRETREKYTYRLTLRGIE